MKCFKKHIIAALVFAFLLQSFCFSANVFAGSIKKGDVDGDGAVKVADVRAALGIAANCSSASAQNLAAADFDGDSNVTALDARLIMQNAIDLSPEYFPECQMLNPKKVNGSTKKVKFVTPVIYKAQTLHETPVNDKSNPLYSDLPIGTYDYVKSGPIAVGDDIDKTYYVLRSGRRVYDNEIKAFTGYELPDNNIELVNVPVYNQNSTDIYLKLKWAVPFNAVIKPQSYETGYDSRPYNLVDDEFTGSYMDIKFYYTPEASGTLTFPKSETVKSTKWIVDAENNTSTLRIYFRNAGAFYGYHTYYSKNNYLVISIKEPVKALKGRTVMIDPGHGGAQPGANSGTGVDEKNLTWKIAVQLKSLLEKAGATVIFTRGNTSKEPEIEDRRVFASEKNPDAFVSIHLDASESRFVHGSSVYYYKNYSGPLAFAIAKSLPKTVKSEIGYSLSNRDAHFYPFCVTRFEECASVLVECGFITNTVSYGAKPTVGEKITQNSSLSMFKDYGEPSGEDYPIIEAEDEAPASSAQIAEKTVYGGGCPYSEPTSNVSYGSEGSGVKWAQWYLYKLGYLNSADDIDGDFGPTTQSAVKAFQKAHGINPDGIVGAKTRPALKNALSNGEASSSGSTPAVSAPNFSCDFKMLNSAVGQAAVAKGIYNGLLDYFGLK